VSQTAGDSLEQALVFGPFRLLRRHKLLLEGDRPVRLGSRALDVLTMLVSRAGEVVSRAELEACVWPDTIVEETSLRVHVSALRKALGDGHAGARFITNVPGRGYCFVAPVARVHDSAVIDDPPAVRQPSHNLPVRLTRMIGRSMVVEALRLLISERRLVTITGPGGMGKTTVALAVAEELLTSFQHGVRLVDFAPVADPMRIPGAVGSALDVSVPSNNPHPALVAHLADRNMLLVLDNCEHVLEAATALAESLLRNCTGISILTTSREPLDAEGESVYRLQALAIPPQAGQLTATQALTFPAVQLFAQRAMGVSDGFELSDADAPFVRDLCWHLDGVPLAIEFAAARVDSLGVRGLAAGLGDRLQLLTRGRRNTLPRHRTLRAMLDWSYELLTKAERLVLCHLSVFKADFSIEWAHAVASDEEIAAGGVSTCVLNLATKSLISADVGGDIVRYRLLETTRAYAVEKLVQSGHSATTFKRHAMLMHDLLAHAQADWDAMTRPQWLTSYCRDMADIRAAIDWCFSSEGDHALGIALTAAALLPVYELGILDEHHEQIERALSRLQLLSPPQPVIEMRLNAALIFPSGQPMRPVSPRSEVVARMLELAQQLGEPRYRIAALYGQWGNDFLAADYPSAIARAEEMGMLARDSADSAAMLLANRLLAQSQHFMGEHLAARANAESVLLQPPRRMPLAYISPVPHAVAMRIVLARIMWLQGQVAQAVALADECVALAAGHPFALTQALALAACPIALWRGDNGAARPLVDKLMDHSMRHPSAYWQTWGPSYDAVLSFRESNVSDAAARVPKPLFETTNTMELDCMGTLTEGPVRPATLLRVEQGLVGWCAPEILRVHGEHLLRQGIDSQSASAAEALYVKSLALARLQGALAWELRTATSLGRIWREQGRMSETRLLVRGTYERFSEGLATADLSAAKRLLDELDA